MKFAAPEYFQLIWLVIALGAFLYWSHKKRKALLKQFADSALLKSLLKDVAKKAFKWKAILSLMGILFLVFALARPQWGFQWEELKQKGNDIFIAIDTSKSMLAEDVKPNRLDRAKREVRDLLQLLQGDRVGLIAFAGTAFVLSPLTLDTAALRLFLDDVDPSLIPQGGTAISQAIRKALQSFPGKEKKYKILILITDGEDLEGDALALAKQAKEQGVTIYTVGIGTPEGAPIPVVDENGTRSFIKNKQGQTVLSKLNVRQLSQLSETGVETSVSEVYEKYILPMEKKEIETTRQKKYEEKFQWFLLIALLFFVLQLFVRETRRKNKVILPLLFFLLFPAVGEARTASGSVKKGNTYFDNENWEGAQNEYVQALSKKPDSALVEYNLGNTLYKQGKYKEATEIFEKALTLRPDETLRPQLLYNLGNAHFKLGKYKEALRNYERALAATPEDEDVQFNYEFVKKLLEQMKQQQEQQQQQPSEKDQEEEKQEGEKQKGEQQQASEQQQGESQEQESMPQQSEEEGEEDKQQSPQASEEEQKEKEEEEAKEQQAGSQKEEDKKEPSGEDQSVSQQQRGNQKREAFTEEEAESLLNSLKEEEINTRELRIFNQQKGKVVAPEKDW